MIPLERGHMTASTALKRLAGFDDKNHFYRANREFGRVLKTENILEYMADPLLRQNRRRGLLKGEQIHQQHIQRCGPHPGQKGTNLFPQVTMPAF
jgi:TnpA family transposase